MQKRRIRILYTGGTIGSSEKNGIIGPDPAMRDYLIERYREVTGDRETEFSFDEPYYILSEYLDGAHINLLTDALRRHIAEASEESETAGIIVTVGSDTVQYVSAAAALLLHHANVPVIFVLSNALLTLPTSNGLDNFVHAVTTLLQRDKTDKDLPAVTVSYKNPGDAPRLFDPLRLYPHLPFDGTLYESPHAFPKSLVYPDPNVQLSDPAPVLLLYPAPGFHYPIPAEGTKAVLLATYHSGTMDTRSASFIKFADETRARGIRIYLLGADRETQYESTEAYAKLGITVLPEMSPVAAYLWLWYKHSEVFV